MAEQGETPNDDRSLLAELSAALDEIWRLRRALAYEAAVTHATLSYKALPKTRRGAMEDAKERMILAALGDTHLAYMDVADVSIRHAMHTIGAKQTVVRHGWQNGRDEAAAGDSPGFLPTSHRSPNPSP